MYNTSKIFLDDCNLIHIKFCILTILWEDCLNYNIGIRLLIPQFHCYFLMDIYVEVELMSHGVCISLASVDTMKQFFKVTVNLQSFSSVRVFWFFHTLTNTWSVIFILYILLTVQYCNIMVVVCNSLRSRKPFHLLLTI